MDFSLTSTPEPMGGDADTAPEIDATEHGFGISATPVISSESEADGATPELPRSYGGETLWLMARDPQTLFAYWDIDWSNAFAEAAPLERQVYLRIMSANGLEEKRIAVEPMAGAHMLDTADANGGYAAELGYYRADGEWKSVAKSSSVNTPPALPSDGVRADVATIPFHLSFQRMLDVLQTPQENSEPLTAKLADLRAQAESGAGDFSAAQRDLVDSIDQVIAKTPPPSFRSDSPSPMWTRERLEQILGFRPTSPAGRFSGSSRPA